MRLRHMEGTGQVLNCTCTETLQSKPSHGTAAYDNDDDGMEEVEEFKVRQCIVLHHTHSFFCKVTTLISEQNG